MYVYISPTLGWVGILTLCRCGPVFEQKKTHKQAPFSLCSLKPLLRRRLPVPLPLSRVLPFPPETSAAAAAQEPFPGSQPSLRPWARRISRRRRRWPRKATTRSCGSYSGRTWNPLITSSIRGSTRWLNPSVPWWSRTPTPTTHWKISFMLQILLFSFFFGTGNCVVCQGSYPV